MEKPYIIVVIVLSIASVILIGKYLSSPTSNPSLKETVVTQNIKDCGSSKSTKGGNTDNMDRNCFLEAYETCMPAKLYQEVIDPDNHAIKTTVFIDTKERDKCRVGVQVEDKFKFPENEIYYCYDVSKTEINNYNIKMDDCKERKPLVF